MIRFIGFLFSSFSIMAIAGVLGIALVSWIYEVELPDHTHLKRYEPATLSRVYSGEGKVIAEYAQERRIFTPIDEIPPLVKAAFISAEDKNFYDHSGVDWFGVVKAMADNVRRVVENRRARGASGITQQVLKIFLLSEENKYERKIKEFILAPRISATMSKDRILELYLNEIFLGQNSYGVTAAARRYYGKALEELGPAEIAYLAALPKAPSDYHPIRQRERAIERRNYVLEEMAQNGHLTRAVAEDEKSKPLATLFSGDLVSQLPPIPNADYFTDEIRRQLSDRLGRNALYGGGLAIRATMDPELQKVAGDALRRKLEDYDRRKGGYQGPLGQLDEISENDEEGWRQKLADFTAPNDIPGWRKAVVLRVGKNGIRVGIHNEPEDEDGHYVSLKDVSDWARPPLDDPDKGLGPRPKRPSDVWTQGDVILLTALKNDEGEFERWSQRQVPGVQGAFMAMDPHTGRVLALQGGFSYEASVFNRATQAKRQPGSAFKPFVYAAALDSGYSPSTIVLDAPVVIEQYGDDEDWKPKNYSDKFYGPSPLRLGIEKSRNLMTVRLAQDVGMPIIADYAERFGVYEDMPYQLSYSLGAGETTLYKMVAAYGMFANGGRRVEPTLVDRIQDRRGVTIYRHDQRICDECVAAEVSVGAEPWPVPVSRRIMDRITAFQLVSMMEGVPTRGTARSLASLGLPLAGKTGTTNESRDAWFVGFTPNLVAGCFIGYDNPKSMGKEGTGGGMCAPVFKEFMKAAMDLRPAGEFAVPEEVEFAPIDRFSGIRLPEGAEEDGDVLLEPFRPGQAPELYETAQVIGEGDGGGFMSGGDLPSGSDLPLDDQPNTPATDQPLSENDPVRPPKPGGGLDDDLDSGGLY
ncbi:MAG: penicillin-binding protein 1A [Pikeienuella sp.]